MKGSGAVPLKPHEGRCPLDPCKGHSPLTRYCTKLCLVQGIGELLKKTDNLKDA